MSEIKQIQTPEELKHFIQIIRPLDYIAVDFEMNNTHFYEPIICLIQILIKNTCYLVNPLSLKDLSSLFKALENKNFIIHGCDYDIRCLHLNYNFFMTNIFDTMIAGQFLNLSRISLYHLVRKFFKISLDKKYQRANWFKRPLKPAMIQYAAQDTFYLPKLKEILYKKLKKKKKLFWYQEYLNHYLVDLNQKLIETNLDSQWEIKGSKKFSSKQLQVLKSIWNWREDFCKINNISRNLFLNNQKILNVASSIPKNNDQPIPWDNIITEVKNKKEIQSVIEKSLEIDCTLWPKEKKLQQVKQPTYVPQIISELKTIRDKIAKQHKLSSQVLPKNKTLEKIGIQIKEFMACNNLQEIGIDMLSWQEGLLLRPWQKHLKKWYKKNNVSL